MYNINLDIAVKCKWAKTDRDKTRVYLKTAVSENSYFV